MTVDHVALNALEADVNALRVLLEQDDGASPTIASLIRAPLERVLSRMPELIETLRAR